MNKEEAIEYLKNLIKNPTISQDPFYTTKIAIDTVLNYIEELEKENAVKESHIKIVSAYNEKLENMLKEKENIVKKSSLEAQKYFDMLMEVEYGRDTIPKQKIRDKIELFELEIETLKTLYPKSYTRDDDYKLYVYKIDVLKELLGE